VAKQQKPTYVGFWGELVETPQPICNPKKTQNQKQLFLQKVMEDEVAGQCSLLLII
jgi:hypothetical protein